MSGRGPGARTCAGYPFCRTTILVGNQPPMPFQERARDHQGSEPLEPLGVDPAGLGGQPPTLVIVEAGLLAQLFFQDPDGSPPGGIQ